MREFDVLEVEGDARSVWWTRANEVWPECNAYQAATERHIPVFELAPRAVTP